MESTNEQPRHMSSSTMSLMVIVLALLNSVQEKSGCGIEVQLEEPTTAPTSRSATAFDVTAELAESTGVRNDWSHTVLG